MVAVTPEPQTEPDDEVRGVQPSAGPDPLQPLVSGEPAQEPLDVPRHDAPDVFEAIVTSSAELDDAVLIVEVNASDPLGTLITLSGELDVHTAQVLARALRGVGPLDRHVAIDMRGVVFCDAGGVRLLFALHTRMVMRGGSLTLYGPPSPSVQRVVDAVGPRGGLTLVFTSPPDH